MNLKNKKTGEIISIDIIKNRDDGSWVWHEPESLKSLNEDWEDVGGTNDPNTPLIKDEKIRKSVKAWADCNKIISVQFDANWRGFRHGNAVITVWEDLPLEDNKIYTIEELCGEEEE